MVLSRYTSCYSHKLLKFKEYDCTSNTNFLIIYRRVGIVDKSELRGYYTSIVYTNIIIHIIMYCIHLIVIMKKETAFCSCIEVFF